MGENLRHFVHIFVVTIAKLAYSPFFKNGGKPQELWIRRMAVNRI